MAVNAVDLGINSSSIVRTSPLLGVSDGKSGTVSFWLKNNALTVQTVCSLGVTGNTDFRFSCIVNNQGGIAVFGVNSAGSLVMWVQTSVAHDDILSWHHYILSWDLEQAQANTKCYIDGVSNELTFIVFTDDDIEYTAGDDVVVGESTADQQADACFAEVYVAFNQYVDLDVAGEVEKWRQAAGDPPDSLGVDGSTPTGTSPSIYLNNQPSTYLSNSGSGGNFDSVAGGAIAACALSPNSFLPGLTTRDSSGTPQSWAVRGSALAGVINSKVGTVSFWVRVDNAGNPSSTITMEMNADRFYRHARFTSTQIENFTVAFEARSVAWDGTNVLSTEVDAAHNLHSGFTSTISSSYAVVTNNNIGWDGTNVLSATTGVAQSVINRHSGFSSTITDSFDAPGLNTFGVAWDGTNLLSASTDNSADGDVHLHDGFTDTVTSTFMAGYTVNGIGWVDHEVISGNLMLVDLDNEVYKIYDGFSSTLVTSFPKESGVLLGGISWMQTADNDRVVVMGSDAPGSGDQTRLLVAIDPFDRIKAEVRNAGADVFTVLSSFDLMTSRATWYHVLIAWDTSSKARIYVDDVDVTDSGGTLGGDETLAYSSIVRWAHSAFAWDNAGSQIAPPDSENFIDCVAQLYVNLKGFTDPDTAANRRLFTSTDGIGINFGSDGSIPTGVVPNIYFNRNNAAFLVNNGDGGDFSLGTGSVAFDPCSTHPPLLATAIVATKAFSVSSIATGAFVTMTLTLDNTQNAMPAVGVTFVDTLPNGLVVNNPSIVVNGCGGILSAVAGSNTISLSLGRIEAGSSCVITVGVTSFSVGSYANSVVVTSSLGVSQPAEATVSFTQDRVLLCPAHDLAYRPDERIHPNASTHCPIDGSPLRSWIDIVRGVESDDDLKEFEEEVF